MASRRGISDGVKLTTHKYGRIYYIYTTHKGYGLVGNGNGLGQARKEAGWASLMLAGGRRVLSGIMKSGTGRFWHGGHWEEEHDGGLSGCDVGLSHFSCIASGHCFCWFPFLGSVASRASASSCWVSMCLG